MIDPSAGYTRGLLRGVLRFAREQSNWRLTHGPFSRGKIQPRDLVSWHGDGVIARVDSAGIGAWINKSGLAAVDVSSSGLLAGHPSVYYDDHAVGTMAAEYLLERGFVTFGFCGNSSLAFSQRRFEAFAKTIGERGFECTCISPAQPASRDWQLNARLLKEWLGKLKRPAAVFSAWDGIGEQVLDACRELQLAVPEQVAVLGVDDDELLCELADPPLSSVRLNCEGAGYAAAALLHQIMTGQRVQPQPRLIAPLEIITRQSTDIQAITDRAVMLSMRYIRENACKPIQVADLADISGVSRRTLEERFRAVLHRSPHDQIVITKTALVRQLLAETDLTLAIIAERTGFDHVETMFAIFKRTEGCTPGQYRQAIRQPNQETQ